MPQGGRGDHLAFSTTKKRHISFIFYIIALFAPNAKSKMQKSNILQFVTVFTGWWPPKSVHLQGVCRAACGQRLPRTAQPTTQRDAGRMPPTAPQAALANRCAAWYNAVTVSRSQPLPFKYLFFTVAAVFAAKGGAH